MDIRLPIHLISMPRSLGHGVVSRVLCAWDDGDDEEESAGVGSATPLLPASDVSGRYAAVLTAHDPFAPIEKLAPPAILSLLPDRYCLLSLPLLLARSGLFSCYARRMPSALGPSLLVHAVPSLTVSRGRSP